MSFLSWMDSSMEVAGLIFLKALAATTPLMVSEMTEASVMCTFVERGYMIQYYCMYGS